MYYPFSDLIIWDGFAFNSFIDGIPMNFTVDTGVSSWTSMPDFHYESSDTIFVGRELNISSRKAIGLEVARVGAWQSFSPINNSNIRLHKSNLNSYSSSGMHVGSWDQQFRHLLYLVSNAQLLLRNQSLHSSA